MPDPKRGHHVRVPSLKKACLYSDKVGYGDAVSLFFILMRLDTAGPNHARTDKKPAKANPPASIPAARRSL